MKRLPTKSVLAAVVGLAFAGAFCATVTLGNPEGPSASAARRPAGPHDAVPARWLNPNPEQVEEIRAADPKFHQDMRRLDRELTIERLKLATLIEAEDFNEAAVKSQFEAVGEKHLAIHRRIADHVLAVRPLLDANQCPRFLDLLAKRFRKGPHAGEPAPPRRPGSGGPGRAGCGPHPPKPGGGGEGSQRPGPGGPAGGPPPPFPPR
jgi:Spy/CpxP family protein refolding chaperone